LKGFLGFRSGSERFGVISGASWAPSGKISFLSSQFCPRAELRNVSFFLHFFHSFMKAIVMVSKHVEGGVQPTSLSYAREKCRRSSLLEKRVGKVVTRSLLVNSMMKEQVSIVD
jgi:hypothetical protein